MSSNQARGWRSPPVHKNKIVLRRTDGHSSSVRLPPFAPYPSTGHSSVGRDVFSYEPPPLLTCLRLTRAFALSTSRACNEVHVEDGSHRVDIRPTSGSLTLQAGTWDRRNARKKYDVFAKPKSVCQTKTMFAKQNKCFPNYKQSDYLPNYLRFAK